MANLEIYKDSSPYLHTKSTDVKFPLTNDVKTLISDMKDTLCNTEFAAGLAAPQVGKLLNLFVYRTDEHPSPMVMINPVIIKACDYSHGQCEMCLSYPGQVYKVHRAKRIAVRFFDEFGEHYVLKYRGFEAMIIQHEVDHLLGLTIKDRGEKLPEELTRKLLNLQRDVEDDYEE